MLLRDLYDGRVRWRIDRGTAALRASLVSRAGGTTASRAVSGTVPTSFRVFPPPRRVATAWPEPPALDGAGDRVWRKAGERDVDEVAVTRPKAGGVRFDIDLFEQLQAEYADRAIDPVPQGKAESRPERARRRLQLVHETIDLADKRVLEIGCGTGFEVWYVAHHFESDAHGIDVSERKAWASLRDERTHLSLQDIGQRTTYPDGHFDRIISFTVWEHIRHPFAALQETFRILRPGGLMWMKANLQRGANASHLTASVAFPYPHLLFTDEVFEEYFRRRGEPGGRPAWVNAVTWAQYEGYFRDVGYETRMLRFTERALDEAFYKRFEDVLGRYPRFDLTRDFFTVVLEKPAASRPRRG
jgi:SAM-dependent methyltransferase